MEAKTQIRGICQCCGREQAVVGGRMSKHGYTVKEGWFQGVCTGNHYEPMQVSRERADLIATTVRADAARLDEKSLAYKEGRDHPAIILKRGIPNLRPDVETPWEEATLREQRDCLEQLSWNAKRRAEIGRAFADDLNKLADAYHGKELTVVTLDAPPPPVYHGDKKMSENGAILTVTRVQGARVFWKTDKGRQGWTGIQSWRKFNNVEAEVV